MADLQPRARPPDPPLSVVLPAGCTILMDAVPEWEVNQTRALLEPLFQNPVDARVKQIQSGLSDQRDGKRKQLQMEPEELAIFGSFKRALEEAGEANGRKLSEYT